MKKLAKIFVLWFNLSLTWITMSITYMRNRCQLYWRSLHISYVSLALTISSMNVKHFSSTMRTKETEYHVNPHWAVKELKIDSETYLGFAVFVLLLFLFTLFGNILTIHVYRRYVHMFSIWNIISYYGFFGKIFSVSKFDRKLSVSETGTKKYSERILCLKKLAFGEK